MNQNSEPNIDSNLGSTNHPLINPNIGTNADPNIQSTFSKSESNLISTNVDLNQCQNSFSNSNERNESGAPKEKKSKQERFLAESFYFRSLPQEEEPLPLKPNFGPKKFRILLIRHAQSISNIDKTILSTMADHIIDISSAGRIQAKEVGVKIKEFYENLWTTQPPSHVRLWTSPYKRARETTKYIMETCGNVISSVKEHIFLGEQQFGLFEGVPVSELSIKYPREYQHFEKCIHYCGRFWARMPLGESRFDVCKRVHELFGVFEKDYEYYDIHDLIIVTHGVTLRSFLMMWNHLTPEWFEEEPNPKNCSIRLLDDHKDHGYIFSGFEENFNPNNTQTLSSHSLQTLERNILSKSSAQLQLDEHK